ncbi:hypothetical protein [uncultured Methanobrevibacter sp.]|uniref:hypothetical protein n=1 Tax=uncultured Methanobrevibacter sp. TaxID=253161 RepID=UPI0025D28290|nr:hypothetical protein [uncultured Methanobrevibacter sp.]
MISIVVVVVLPFVPVNIMEPISGSFDRLFNPSYVPTLRKSQPGKLFPIPPLSPTTFEPNLPIPLARLYIKSFIICI